MFESFLPILGYSLLILVVSIWMIVRIAKRSRMMAILTFIAWPFAIVPLVTNWGDEESDIRVPFLLCMLLAGLGGYHWFRATEYQAQDDDFGVAYMLSDEELAEIRADDPDFAAELEAARSEQRAALMASGDAEEGDWDDDAIASDDGVELSATGIPVVERSAEATAAANAPRDPAVLDAEHRATLERAAGHLAWQFGRVELPGAGHVLQLPRNFRFAARATLHHLARLRHVSVPIEVLGWIVYRDVSLAREDAWYVQVRRVTLPAALAPPEALIDDTTRQLEDAAFVGRVAQALGVDPATVSAPTWDGANALATFRQAAAAGATPEFADIVAVRVTSGALLEFRAPMLHAAHAELGSRATRTMALRTSASSAAAR